MGTSRTPPIPTQPIKIPMPKARAPIAKISRPVITSMPVLGASPPPKFSITGKKKNGLVYVWDFVPAKN